MKWFIIFQVEIKKNCYWCPGPTNRPRPQIEPHQNSWQYPLINYLGRVVGLGPGHWWRLMCLRDLRPNGCECPRSWKREKTNQYSTKHLPKDLLNAYKPMYFVRNINGYQWIAKFWKAINESCVTSTEFPFSNRGQRATLK